VIGIYLCFAGCFFGEVLVLVTRVFFAAAFFAVNANASVPAPVSAGPHLILGALCAEVMKRTGTPPTLPLVAGLTLAQSPLVRPEFWMTPVAVQT
jgi:hypothetical protein